MTLMTIGDALSGDDVQQQHQASALHCHSAGNLEVAYPHDHGRQNGHSSFGSTGRRITIVLAITSVCYVVQIVAAIATNSLALFADSGHLLSDVAALGLALFAFWLGQRPATYGRTFGYRRAEILASLVNGGLLVVVAASTVWEGAQRLYLPPTVQGLPMFIVAVFGLVANLLSLRILGHSTGLNERGAFLHVFGDMISSIAVVAASVLMLLFGWFLADPLLSIGIAAVIFVGGVRLIRSAVDVLLLTAPVDVAAVAATIRSESDVVAVHDLHAWTITSGFVSLSAHVSVRPAADLCEVLGRLIARLRSDFGIEHSTLQLEHEAAARTLHPDCSPCVDQPAAADRS